MDVQVNKKVIKIIIAIIVIIGLIAGGIFAAKAISTNIEINETKEKLSKIDAKELENKIIKELENTKLKYDANFSENNLLAITEFTDGVNFEDYISGMTLCVKNGNPTAAVEYPCFKINSDSNGNFKNIEYAELVMDGNIVEKAVKKVFKEEYDVDMEIAGNQSYNKKFNKFSKDYKYTNKGNIYISDQNFFIVLLAKVTYNTNYDYGDKVPDSCKEYRTVTFGIDF